MNVQPVFTDVLAALEEAHWLADAKRKAHGVYPIKNGLVVRRVGECSGDALEIVHPIEKKK